MMVSSKPLAVAISVIAIFSMLLIPRAGQAENGYTLGVFPFLPPVRLEERHGYFAIVLSRALAHRVEFRTRSTFSGFKQDIKDQIYEIIFVQPFDFVVAADKYGYLPLAKANEPLTAIIVAKVNSDLTTLRGLAHKVLAMPPMSAAVSRLGQAALLKIGLDVQSDLTMLHFRTHPACMQAVLIGDADACVTNIVPLRVFRSFRKAKFRTLAETESIPHVLFAVHKRVPRKEREVIRGAIIGLNGTATGREFLKQSGWLKGFVAAKNKEYDIVRSIADRSDLK